MGVDDDHRFCPPSVLSEAHHNSMTSAYVGAIRRIWAQIVANASDIDDLFERIIQSFYSKVINPGDTTVDGGSHTGRHTIPLALLVGDDGVVFAFEPLAQPSKRLLEL